MAGVPWSACKPALARFMCTNEGSVGVVRCKPTWVEESTAAGSGLCTSPIARDPRVHRYRVVHARARHRRQLCHFHAGQWRSIRQPRPGRGETHRRALPHVQHACRDLSHSRTRWEDDHVKMILRASPSGSFTIRHSLSQIIVLLVSGSVGCQFKTRQARAFRCLEHIGTRPFGSRMTSSSQIQKCSGCRDISFSAGLPV
jgi:hypothetical protein